MIKHRAFAIIMLLSTVFSNAQINDEENTINHLHLYEDLITIIRENFISPFTDQPLVAIRDSVRNFGRLTNLFTGQFFFSNMGFFAWNDNFAFHSMSDGIVRGIFPNQILVDRFRNLIVVEYNENLQIHYAGIMQEGIMEGDKIVRGQLIGTREPYFFDGMFFLRIKYNGIFLNPYVILSHLIE